MKKEPIFNKMEKYLLVVLVTFHCCRDTMTKQLIKEKKTFKGMDLVYSFRE